jgi:hypothetical protein
MGTDNRAVTALHSVPPRSRALLGSGLAVPSAALLGAGVVMLARGSGVMVGIVAVLVICGSVVLLAVSVGLLTSAVRDRRRMQAAADEAALDAAIMNSEAYRSLGCSDMCGGTDCAVEDCAVKSLPRSSGPQAVPHRVAEGQP